MTIKKDYLRIIIIVLIIVTTYLLLLWLVSPGMFNDKLPSQNISPPPALDYEFLIELDQKINSDMKLCEIGYWPFNQDIIDSTERYNNSISHEITFTKGIEQDAAIFNGTDSYIKIGHKDDFNIDDKNFAVTVWVKLNQFELEGRAFQIFYKGSEQKGYELQVSDWYLELYIIDNKNRDVVSSYPMQVTANEWHFITVLNMDGEIYLYLDNQLLKQIFVSVHTDNLNDLYLGYDPILNEYWSGLIDELHIYNNCSHFVNF